MYKITHIHHNILLLLILKYSHMRRLDFSRKKKKISDTSPDTMEIRKEEWKLFNGYRVSVLRDKRNSKIGCIV